MCRPDVFNQKVVRARKQHECCECRMPIYPGEEYERVEGLWDGGWDCYKSCLSCAGWREVVYTKCEVYEEVLYTELFENINYLFGYKVGDEYVFSYF